MFEPEDRGVWSEGHQKMHTLYWSTFLGLPSGYDTTRFRDRYHPATSLRAANDLLAHWKSRAKPRILPSFQKLALWTLAPRFFGGASARLSPTDAAAFDRTRDEVRTAFQEQFGFDLAADRGWDDRLLVPEMPDLEIEGARIETLARPRSMRATLDAIVTLPYARLRSVVHPSSWACCPFWAAVPEKRSLTDGAPPETLSAAVRLPGGWWPDANKVRAVELEVDLADSPFETRLDYRGKESRPPGARTWQSPRSGDHDDGEVLSVELAPFVGFFEVSKLPGRPGVCRIVAQREAGFFDFNHDHFCAQTLSYWLASELVALVGEVERP